MHNINHLNIVYISYRIHSIFHSELKPNANKDPWIPIPPHENLVLLYIFTFILDYFSVLSADKVPIKNPIYSLHY